MQGSSNIEMTEIQMREYQYSPSRWSHRFGPDEVISEHIRQIKEGSELAKKTTECETGISYGLSENEKLDIFGANTLPGDAPIFLYIHGGYWQQLGREISCSCVPALCKAGAVVVIIGYGLAPSVGMDEIVSQVKKAVTFVLKLAARRGSSGVYLGGHSAGGHLAAMMLAQDWMQECMINSSHIRGAVLVSGVFDLQPIVGTYINEPIKMNIEEAIRNSPVCVHNKILQYSDKRIILVAVGEHDSPEFKRQSQEFHDTLVGGGIDSTSITVSDTDHFNIVEQMSDEDYSLTREIIQLMGLNLSSIVSQMENSTVS